MKQKLMEELVNVLNEATILYDAGIPSMTDKEWDEKYFMLMALEKELGYKLENSPTEKIFYQQVNELKKVKHNHNMLSLAKTKDIAEAEKAMLKQEYLIMLKLDGLTCSIRYLDGKLVSAETRGDGIIGEDITHNAMVISSIPKYIPYKEELILDGEMICTYSNFEEFASEYKNPRNFAAGSIRLLDNKECKNRKLTFVVWEVIKGFEEEKQLCKKLLKVDNLGFTIVPFRMSYEKPVKNIVEILKERAEIKGYPIDGLVFKIDDIEYGKSLGKTAHHFNNAIAYKFFDEVYTTYVKYIEWTIGRTGILTPVAVLQPIDIDGSTVERASLHNVSILKQLGLKYQNQKVEIFKANQIIPQVARTFPYEYETASVSGMEIPETCPICGGKTYIKMDNESEILMCSSPTCQGKLINKLDHFCGKKGLDIKGLSKATLEKLIDWGWIENYSDLFSLHAHVEEWINKPGFGEKSVEKLLIAISNSRVTTLDAVISAIGIPLIGKTVSKDLAKRFKTYECFREHIDLSFDFSQIDGYGPEMTKALLTFDYSELDYIVNKYLTIIYNEEEKKEKTLEGMTIVITGKLKLHKNRDILKSKIETSGGKVSGSVTKKTDYLINNDTESTTAKNKVAKDLGIPIISEEDFIKIFDL